MQLIEKLSKDQILSFLMDMDNSFFPALSNRVNLKGYSEKLLQHAFLFSYRKNGEIAAAVFFYIDSNKKEAYIPVLGAQVKHRGKGFIHSLMRITEKKLLSEGIKMIRLETWSGSKALNYYMKNGYLIEKTIKDRPDNFQSVHLKKDLRNYFPKFNFSETPLEYNHRLNLHLGIDLFIKRDDLFPVTGGGSKARKLKFILKKAVEQGCTAVVTTGSNNSNHLRATAVFCAELGLKFTACIHDTRPDSEAIRGNLRLTTEMADRVIYTTLAEVKSCMDNAINKYVEEGEKPIYIWGGGHSVEGSYAFYEGALELIKNLTFVPDYILLASGTGTTQAGVFLATKNSIPECKVIGISIAREVERGKEAIYNSALELNNFIQSKDQILSEDIIFNTDYLDGGYGVFTNANLGKLSYYMKNYGLVLDPIYSGKAFLGLIDLVEKGKIPKSSKVIFWNTGGLLNIVK